MNLTKHTLTVPAQAVGTGPIYIYEPSPAPPTLTPTTTTPDQFRHPNWGISLPSSTLPADLGAILNPYDYAQCFIRAVRRPPIVIASSSDLINWEGLERRIRKAKTLNMGPDQALVGLPMRLSIDVSPGRRHPRLYGLITRITLI